MIQFFQIVAAIYLLLCGAFFCAVSCHGVWRDERVSSRELGLAFVGAILMGFAVLTAAAPT